MITISDAAKAKVLELMAGEGQQGQGVRLGIRGRAAAGFIYDLRFEPESTVKADDIVIDAGGFKFFVDAKSAPDVEGVSIDYVDDLQGSGFKIDNPNPVWKNPTALAVQQVIDSQINPSVASHGGHVMLLDVKDDVAYIQLGGGCQGCGMADVTLKQGIEVAIKEAVPEIHRIVDSTDHAGGSNPFYKPAKGGESPFA
jgi:Fe/S biogenesis protein NfuA